MLRYLRPALFGAGLLLHACGSVPAFAQSVPVQGSASTISGSATYDLLPRVIYNRACNNNTGNIVGQLETSGPNAGQACGLPVTDYSSAPFTGAVAMVVGTTYAAQRSIAVNCTAAGNISLTLADGSAILIPVQPGFQTLPFSVTAINSSGTTAVATYSSLK